MVFPISNTALDRGQYSGQVAPDSKVRLCSITMLNQQNGAYVSLWALRRAMSAVNVGCCMLRYESRLGSTCRAHLLALLHPRPRFALANRETRPYVKDIGLCERACIMRDVEVESASRGELEIVFRAHYTLFFAGTG